MISNVVIGLGETGQPLYEILKATFQDTIGYDAKNGPLRATVDGCDMLHICIPYQIPDFTGTVEGYQDWFKPQLTIIHSTVPIGTTAQFRNAVHSPILGDHTNMKQSLLLFPKWIGGEKAVEASIVLKMAGMETITVTKSEATEALKLMCLAKYGMSIAFAQYQQEVCDKYGFSYGIVTEWDRLYNSFVDPSKQRPILTPPGERIGGHCVAQGTKILNENDSNPVLQEILKYA